MRRSISEHPQNNQPTSQLTHPFTPRCSILLAIKSEVWLEAGRADIADKGHFYEGQEKASIKEVLYNFPSRPRHPQETHVKTSLIRLQVLVIICSSWLETGRKGFLEAVALSYSKPPRGNHCETFLKYSSRSLA